MPSLSLVPELVKVLPESRELTLAQFEALQDYSNQYYEVIQYCGTYPQAKDFLWVYCTYTICYQGDYCSYVALAKDYQILTGDVIQCWVYEGHPELEHALDHDGLGPMTDQNLGNRQKASPRPALESVEIRIL